MQPASTEIYTLSLHDALPISSWKRATPSPATSIGAAASCRWRTRSSSSSSSSSRSEEHTSELQSHSDLVCRLLLEKKNAFSLKLLRAVERATRTFQLTPSPC